MRMTQSAAKGRSFRASSRARLLATAVFLGAATASAPFLTPAFAQVFSFSNVEIQGNDRVDAATILNYAGISRGKEVSTAQLNDAYQRIVNSNLFETVELVPQGRPW
jgi:outer membrane protein insertion porin family